MAKAHAVVPRRGRRRYGACPQVFLKLLRRNRSAPEGRWLGRTDSEATMTCKNIRSSPRKARLQPLHFRGGKKKGAGLLHAFFLSHLQENMAWGWGSW